MPRTNVLVAALLLACLSIVFPHGLFAADPTFTMKSYPAGSSVGKMLTADFNRDGIPDLVLVTAGGVAVLLGNGDGSFRPPATYATANGPQGLAVGDFNGDGIVDVATGNFASHTISVLLGNGDGTLKAHIDAPVPTNSNTIDIAAADFTRDGKVDVIVASGQIYLFRGNGDGTFQSPVQIGTPPFGNAHNIVAGDFNGDGRPDAIYSDCCDPQIDAAPVATNVFLINSGDGNLFSPVSTTDAEIFAMATLNANGDNIPDLSTSFSGCHTPCVGGEVWIGQQGNAFPKGVVGLAVPDFDQPIPGPAVGADFNGDGKIDLAYMVASFVGSSDPITTPREDAILIMSGTGAATWSTTPLVFRLGVANPGFGWTVTADFNNDGKPDIATTSPAGGTVAVLLNTTGGTSTPGDFALALSPTAATVSKGQSATATVNISPQAGFNGAVSLSCANLPAGANCTFNPASVTASGSAVTSTLTITTAAPSTAVLRHRSGGIFGVALALFGAVLMTPLRGRRKHIFYLAITLVLLVSLVACGGVSKSNSTATPSPSPGPAPSPGPTPTPPPAGGTPAGTYTVTVVGKSGSLQHSTDFTLMVK